MSSILRALKKLESDPRHQEESRPLDSKFVPLADTVPPRGPQHAVLLVIGGGVICGLVVLAGWWLFSAKMTSVADAPGNIPQQNLQQPERVPAALPPEKTAGPVEVAMPVEPPAGAPTAPQKAEEIPVAPALVEKSPVPPAPEKSAVPATEPAPEPAVVIPEPEPAVPVPVPEAPHIRVQAPEPAAALPAAASAQPAAEPEKPALPVLNDPQLKLQAITWSRDPQRRIVVINNRILRQGDVVLGYRIKTINQDDVVLSDDESESILMFRIK